MKLKHGTVIHDIPIRRITPLPQPPPGTQHDDENNDPAAVVAVAPILDVSRTDDGRRVTFTFRFAATDEDGEEDGAEMEDRDETTFLCAEDNRVNQRVLMKYLGMYGQNFVLCSNGLEALEAYKKDPDRYCCILMDTAMPTMDGYESARLILAHQSANPHLRRPVMVLMTPFAVANPHDDRRLSGFDAHVCKPLSPGNLYGRFLGGPDTNVLLREGSGLTERERRGYPLERQKTWGPRALADGDEDGDGVVCPRELAVRRYLVDLREKGEVSAENFVVVRVEVEGLSKGWVWVEPEEKEKEEKEKEEKEKEEKEKEEKEDGDGART
ncbi:CheY-like superfamily [Xylariomycetidae sp. FL2044]|nr:CheY-like superfamily [Xylariomycetidae sp. FL2044]